MIRIQQFNKYQLDEFIRSTEFDQMENIPISTHRAVSHINNPRAKNDDVLLFVAYDENEMVGYLGALPDRLWINKQFEHCAWLSCIWVSPQHRGKKIAFQLVQDCFKAWNNRILITEYTLPAKKLYLKTGDFSGLKKLEGLRLYVRSEFSRILPPKKKIYKQLRPLIKVTDTLFNLVGDLRFLLYSTQLPNIQLEFIEEIDEEIQLFIQKKQHNQLFKRSANELNWIIQYPWVLSLPNKNEAERERYHFSSSDRFFEFVPLKVRNSSGGLIGFLLFSRRNKHLRLPYCYFEDTEVIMKVIEHLLIKWKVSTFTVYHEALRMALKNSKTIAIAKKKIERGYMISNQFDLELLKEGFEIQDGDADCSFT